MNAARAFTTVDEQLIAAVPEFRGLAGRRVELIAIESTGPDDRDEREAALDDPPRRHSAAAAFGIVKGLESLSLADEQRMLEEARAEKFG